MSVRRYKRARGVRGLHGADFCNPGSFLIAIAVCFGALFALVMHFRRSSQTKLFGTREDADLERLWSMSNRNASFAIFEEVFQTIAKELGIHPGRLRPSDRLSEIFRVDSWQLGGAQDAIEGLIRKKTENRPPRVDTIQDLITWLDNEQSK